MPKESKMQKELIEKEIEHKKSLIKELEKDTSNSLVLNLFKKELMKLEEAYESIKENEVIKEHSDDLKKGKLMNYRFKIRNYREGIINKHELKYILKFEVGDNMDFKLYENNKFKNTKNNTLENILKAKTKEEYSYTIAITAKEDIKKGHMSFEIK